MKKTLSIITALMIVGATLFAGGSKESSNTQEIYFLNFKPEIASVYDEVGKAYEAETGVRLKVVTAASGTYEQTLTSEVVKNNPPVIFQINGPIGLKSWIDYTADLKDTALYNILSDKSLAVTSGSGVYGIPYVVEGYGIIYNDAILREYFALPAKAVSISSASEIKNFATLKAVVEDIQKNRASLGIEGAFASTSFAPGNDWRWQTHLANQPMFYEFNDSKGSGSALEAGLATKEAAFSYGLYYKNLFDLYLNNSITAPGLLGNKSVDDSMAEFALGRVAFVQNGNWGASQILGVQGNTVKDEDIKFLPLYFGIPGEENYGLNIGTENYFAINKTVSADKQQAAIDFLVWLFSSDTGKDFVINKLGFIAPFNTFGPDEQPSDPLAKEVVRWLNTPGVTSVPWVFQAFPSEAFKQSFGAALLEYAQGSKTWTQVEDIFRSAWKTESAL